LYQEKAAQRPKILRRKTMNTIVQNKIDIRPLSLAINANNANDLSQFYQNIIGLRIAKRDGERITLKLTDDSPPLITINQLSQPQKSDNRRAGLYHVAILLPNRKDLALFLAHILKSGYPLTGAADHDVSEAVYLSDPEGNGIEIYIDRPSSSWRRTENGIYMHTIELDSQGLFSLIGPDDQWEFLPEETIIGHFHLEAAGRFYHDILGFDITLKWPGALFLSTGGYHHHIGLNTWSSERGAEWKAERPGIALAELKTTNTEALNELKHRLSENRIPFETAESSIALSDPSGIPIRISA
jgi:catechol 2,3-dioxygenase